MTLLVLLIGCSENTLINQKETPTVVEDGSIRGRICDPSGSHWLPDALAYVNLKDADGVVYDTRMSYSDVEGWWMLDELPGENEYHIYVQYGPTIIDEETIWLGSGDVIELEQPPCFDPLAIDVAVITGNYDDFSEVLDSIGFANYTLVDGLDETVLSGFLTNPSEMQKYDIIFFNGGFIEDGVIYGTSDIGVSPEEVMTNITEYVSLGGVIYASDWAYDLVEAGWPDRVEWVGDDLTPDDAQQGDYALVNAAVTDGALSEYLGTEYMEVLYDLPVWPPAESVTTSTSVHLTASVPYSDGMSEYTLAQVPILFSFNSGNGKVVFSTFRMARNSNEQMLSTLQYMMYSL